MRARLPLLLVALGMSIFVSVAHASAPRGANALSKRAQLRYEDVLTTTMGTKWRGRIVQKGEVFIIRLEDRSEIAVAQADVQSVTRELATGILHTGQWGMRASVGGEIAVVAAEENAGPQYGGLVEAALTYNFGGPFEPEVVLLLAPLGPDDGQYSWQLAVATRYYLVHDRRAKPFTETQVVFYGKYGDLGLRTGPGFLFDLGPAFGFGLRQGVTLMSQSSPRSTGVGYHVLFNAQGRF